MPHYRPWCGPVGCGGVDLEIASGGDFCTLLVELVELASLAPGCDGGHCSAACLVRVELPYCGAVYCHSALVYSPCCFAGSSLSSSENVE